MYLWDRFWHLLTYSIRAEPVGCGALFLLPLWTHLGVRYVSLLQGKVGRGWVGGLGRSVWPETWFVGLEGDDFHISRPSHVYRQSPLSPYKEFHFRRDRERERECAFSNLEQHPQGFTCSDVIEQKTIEWEMEFYSDPINVFYAIIHYFPLFIIMLSHLKGYFVRP